MLPMRNLKIISYNEVNKEWENLLTMGSADILDIDKDGKEELVARSREGLGEVCHSL